MFKNSKRGISGLLAFVMLMSLMCTNIGVVNLFADARKIQVWDFGGVAQAGDMYTNNISLDFLNAHTGFPSGKWAAAGDNDFNGVTVNVVANDRMFNAGTNNYGSNAKGSVNFGDGYVANGMYYANGTGGNARRYATVNNVYAGDKITVYAGTSNSVDTNTYCEYVGTGGTQQDVQVLPSTSGKLEYIAKYNGAYKVWFDAAGGKPVINRIMLTPSVVVTGSVDTSGVTGLGEYSLIFTNKTTGDEVTATLEGNSFSATLTPGYDYTASMSGAIGFGPTNATKTISIPNTAVESGAVSGISIVVEVKALYKANGSITGFAADYDRVSDLAVTLVPPEESLCDVVIPTVNADLTYTATLEPDVEYSVNLEGVNDYEVIGGGTFSSSADITQNIVVAEKAKYSASGRFVTLDGSAFTESVAGVMFTNVEDGYSYYTDAVDGGYAIDLRDGAYSAEVDITGYATNSHVVVSGEAAAKDLLVVSTNTEITPVEWKADIYVNAKDSSAYATINEAVAAAKAMAPTSEDTRVTIHIAPATYREQIIVDVPYISFVNDSDTEDVILSWYYGIGYQYYSADATGYYNDENAFDKYDKNSASKWGVGTYIKSAATAFMADGITFEASFNKYVTDEELADGVAPGGADAKNFERKISSDVTAKASTERSSALAIEADKSEFVNCSMIGSQDTLYTGTGINVYIKNCEIEGNTDFMFGDGDIVFDTCELRWCGYSDTAAGGYLTAVKDTATYGYLYRNCTVTARKTAYADDSIKMLQAAGAFGRTWGAGAKVAFLNTKLEDTTMIGTAGWGNMNGDPANANYKEYNTISLDKNTVDTSGRTAGTVITDASSINVKDYFGSDWTPYNFVEEDATVAIQGAVSISDNGDVNLPKWGHSLTAYYSLGANNDANDATVVEWYKVDTAGNETFITATTASMGNTYKIQQTDIGYYIKAVIKPETTSGATGESASYQIAAIVGEGYENPDDKSDVNVGDGINVFLAGDSTVKDYSAGAINNATTRVEGSWGEFIDEFFTGAVNVYNYANGGRSSESFISEGSLDTIAANMKEGDYLLVQFGHNDCSYTYADRYVPVGTPDENGVYPITAPTETERGSFKYYLKQYIDTAREKGATPVLCTPVSRMYFNSDGTIKAHHDDNTSTDNAYVKAVIQLGEEEGVQVFDTFEMTKNLYEEAYKVDGANGTSALATRLFAPSEKTHHSKLGGLIIAGMLAEEIQESSLGLGNYVVSPTRVDGIDHEGKSEFTISSNGLLTAYDKNANDEYTIVDSYWSKYGNEIFALINGSGGDEDTSTEVSTETTTEYEPTTDTSEVEPTTDESTETTTAIVSSDFSMTNAKAVKSGNMLFISAGVSGLNAQEVGFFATANGKPVKLDTNTVYRGFDNISDDVEAVLNLGSNKFSAVFCITDVPAGAEFEITPYHIQQNGELKVSEHIKNVSVISNYGLQDEVISGEAMTTAGGVDMLNKEGVDLYDEAI